MKCPHCGKTVGSDLYIETYYRRRAAGGKVTLKQLATEYGMSYINLLKHKQRYDKAGKWGSKAAKI